MKNHYLITFFLLFNLFVYSQTKNVNNYKYVIVPEKFDFLKENDEYQTSSLTKFLLKKNGYTVILDSEKYPTELKEDRCKALTANVVNESSLFKIKVIIELKDCFNNVVYTSKEGVSNLKDYKRGYIEAIRNAHASMSDISYTPLKDNDIVTKPKVVKPIVKKDNIIKIKDTITAIVTNPKQDISITTLYAQPKENGFQLINLKPEVVYLLLKTTIKDVYLIKDKNGFMYKKDAIWVAEFYENGELIQEEYQIKF